MKSGIKILFTLAVIAAITVFAVQKYTKTALYNEFEAYPERYSDIVEKYSRQYGVETAIIYATILCESGFDEKAVSSAGAQGLMQITPETFEWLCTKTGDNAEEIDIFDADTNIRYGTLLLSMLYEEYGDATVAHAAYNAGRGRIREWMKNEAYYKDGKLYNIPFRETRNYVTKIKNATDKYRNISEVRNERAYF